MQTAFVVVPLALTSLVLSALGWRSFTARRHSLRLHVITDKLHDCYVITGASVPTTDLLEALKLSPNFGKLFRRTSKDDLAEWLAKLETQGKARRGNNDLWIPVR